MLFYIQAIKIETIYIIIHISVWKPGNIIRYLLYRCTDSLLYTDKKSTSNSFSICVHDNVFSEKFSYIRIYFACSIYNIIVWFKTDRFEIILWKNSFAPSVASRNKRNTFSIFCFWISHYILKRVVSPESRQYSYFIIYNTLIN